ncbi:MAG: hypothetical protein ACKVW3_02415 [Phycisphaerales bacterium]
MKSLPRAVVAIAGSVTSVASAQSLTPLTGGISQGAKSPRGACFDAAPLIYSNCNIKTGPTTLSGVGGLPAGAEWSEAARDEVDPFSSNATAGFNVTGALRLADDFVVPPGGVDLAFVKVYAYAIGATVPGVTAATLRILDGSPTGAANVVYGDQTTNRLAHTAFAPIYRCLNTVVPISCGGTPTTPVQSRHLQEVYIAVNQFLPAGTYWLDFNVTGASFSPPATQADAIGRQCDPTNSNALQFNGGWFPMNDTGQGCTPTVARLDTYFELFGQFGTLACYANCDASTAVPVLNMNDFVCFNIRFATGDPRANCDGSTTQPILNVIDFICFTNAYAAGCSAP